MRYASRSRYLVVVLLGIMVISGCGSMQRGAAPAAAAGGAGCEILVVQATTSLNAPIVVPSGGVVCAHGSLVFNDANVIQLQQSVTHGPDCNITYQVGSSTYVINAQQNFCEFKAGQVTANVIAGNATVTTTIGSFSQAQPGMVNVTLN